MSESVTAWCKVQTLLENHVIAVSESESNASTIHRANDSRQREHCNGGTHCLTSAFTAHCNALVVLQRCETHAHSLSFDESRVNRAPIPSVTPLLRPDHTCSLLNHWIATLACRVLP